MLEFGSGEGGGAELAIAQAREFLEDIVRRGRLCSLFWPMGRSLTLAKDMMTQAPLSRIVWE